MRKPKQAGANWPDRATAAADLTSTSGETVTTRTLTVWKRRGAPIPGVQSPIPKAPLLAWVAAQPGPGRPPSEDTPAINRERAKWWRLRNRSLAVAIAVAERQAEKDLHPLSEDQEAMKAALLDLHQRLLTTLPENLAEIADKYRGDFEDLRDRCRHAVLSLVFDPARKAAGLPPMDFAESQSLVRKRYDPGETYDIPVPWDYKNNCPAAESPTATEEGKSP